MQNFAGQFFGNFDSKQDFDKIAISIASPEQIRSWSHGEVKKPETINYRTFKPERDGLFCARTFGPIKDYECLCGKYKRIKYKGIVCEKCGVQVTTAKVRRERMGHIDLATPIAHIWFLKALPSRISTLMDIPLKTLEQVLYFESYIVTEPGLTDLNQGDLMTEDQVYAAREKYGDDSFVVMIGAEAIRYILQNLNLEKERERLKESLIDMSSELKKRKVLKRLKLIEAFISSGNRPEWMIMTVLPVIPPDIRPLVMLDGGRFATSDLNELYRRVINRNNRLKRLIELNAPDIIVRNEKRMLQEAVDALFDNSRRSRPLKNSSKRAFKSLSDMLKGKQGRFRQNLLGKRVDYSGRSVIVVGPTLKLHQCGLPKKMALELFKPFIYNKMELYGISNSIKTSKMIVEAERPEVWDILAEVIREHPVLLNRAPTLHRLGIQAFEPILIEGKAIQLHPLVCVAFNADFDGDQMAVHVPLSIEAQMEARVLMMSTNNILSPSSGKPIIVPDQDIVLGLYNLTLEDHSVAGDRVPAFSDTAEIEHAIFSGDLKIQQKIRYRVKNYDGSTRVVDTTAGRVILFELLPQNEKMSFDLINKLHTKKDISALVDSVYRHCGQKQTVIFADKLMALGFKYSTKAGISFGKDDMIIPDSKKRHIDHTLSEIKEYENQYSEGLITSGEKYNKVIDAWSLCTDRIAEDMMTAISANNSKGDKELAKNSYVNSIYMMAHSGARGSATQIRQLAGMRGLMAKPSGEIIETPIISNFKEGLTVLEYFDSAHGARKGLADTALKTANSGYLTRRLVDVSQDCIIAEYDCGTENGIIAANEIEGSNIVIHVADSILGRTLAQDIIDENNVMIAKAGDLVDEKLSEQIKSLSVIDSIKVRSILTCQSLNGVCAKCYGRDLATGDLVSIGESVGVVAAQSIGEPGTQLTMRTFHIGGAAQRGAEKSSIESFVDGKVEFSDLFTVKNTSGNFVVMSRSGEVVVKNHSKEIARYKIPYGANLYVENNGKIEKGKKVADWDPYTTPILTEKSGTIKYRDLVEGVSFREETDDITGIAKHVVIDWKGRTEASKIVPRMVLTDSKGEIIKLSGGTEARYFLSVGAILNVADGQKVEAGDILARIPRASSKTSDITGGLPRVAELFEARKPKNNSFIAEISGRVIFGDDYKAKRRVIIKSEQDETEIEYLIPKGKHIHVQEGDFIKRGDLLMDGDPVPHDILRVLGVEALAKYMINEIQKVYRLQGIKIDNKHIEVVISQMLKKHEITDAGDSEFMVGEQISKSAIKHANRNIKENEGKEVASIPILQGITKSSLQTDSFISAASFQETTKVLTEAAVLGKEDNLFGLKENVIVGRLIPSGTGFYIRSLKKEAHLRDKLAPREELVEENNSQEDVEEKTKEVNSKKKKVSKA